MMKLPTPKNVTLRNGRTFYAKYKRVKRSNLPPKMVFKKHTMQDKGEAVAAQVVKQWQLSREFTPWVKRLRTAMSESF